MSVQDDNQAHEFSQLMSFITTQLPPNYQDDILETVYESEGLLPYLRLTSTWEP